MSTMVCTNFVLLDEIDTLDDVKVNLVAELAKNVQQQGWQFHSWPTLSVDSTSVAGSLVVTARAEVGRPLDVDLRQRVAGIARDLLGDAARREKTARQYPKTRAWAHDYALMMNSARRQREAAKLLTDALERS